MTVPVAKIANRLAAQVHCKNEVAICRIIPADSSRESGFGQVV